MRRILSLPLMAVLAACVGTGSQPVWLKPGTPALAAEQDFLACAAQARRDFPADVRITSRPNVTIGIGARRCDGPFCYGGFNQAPIISERDANEDLRDRALDLCMTTRGYAERALPRCTTSAAILASQPFDTTGLCVADGRIAAPR